MDSAHCAVEDSRADKTQTTEKAFECNICLKRYTKKLILTEHYREHTGEEPFQCVTCLKKFSKKSIFNRHIRGHCNEKPYECEMCQKKFTEKHLLTNHIRVHTGEKPFQCNICLKKFKEKGHLIRHIKVHTGEARGEASFPVYTEPYMVRCDICKKSVNKSYLPNHLKLHSSEQPFQCICCHKRFTFKCHLLKHIKLHTKKKLFKCDFCQQRIFSNSDLTRYIEEHTGKKPFQCDSCLEEHGLKNEETNRIAVENSSSQNHSETQMETWVNNEFGDGVDAKVKVENFEDTFSPTVSTFDNAWVESDCKIELVRHDLELHSDISQHIVKIEKNSEEDSDNNL